jgi:CMP-N-acetylneuraminic acid synthetase
VFTATSFAKTNSRIGINPYLMVSPPLESIDIDEKSDWVIAESVALYQKDRELKHQDRT